VTILIGNYACTDVKYKHVKMYRANNRKQL